MESSTTSSGTWNLSENGIDSLTTVETADSLDGDYTQTETGTDSYTLVDTGTLGSGAYSETVTGTDTISQLETGNTIEGTYTRNVDGGGSYTRTETGGSLGSGSGTNSYSLTETANVNTGDFSLTETGTDRYELLEQFDNIAQTSGVSTPGHMNYNPFGDAFTDDPPASSTIPTSPQTPEERYDEILRSYGIRRIQIPEKKVSPPATDSDAPAIPLLPASGSVYDWFYRWGITPSIPIPPGLLVPPGIYELPRPGQSGNATAERNSRIIGCLPKSLMSQNIGFRRGRHRLALRSLVSSQYFRLGKNQQKRILLLRYSPGPIKIDVENQRKRL